MGAVKDDVTKAMKNLVIYRQDNAFIIKNISLKILPGKHRFEQGFVTSVS